MTLKNTCILTAASMVLATGCAFADGNAFTPLNFDDTAYSVPTTTTKMNTVSAATTNNQGMVDTTVQTQATGNQDLQTAISKIDTALDDIRNEQNTCKAKYAEIDNQYKFVKNERSNMKKQIRANEKRIRALTKAKTNVGKNVL
ncbi:hypothetical protein IJ843_01805 [bacterium]|nr:hypothetical protein [bacterium]